MNLDVPNLEIIQRRNQLRAQVEKARRAKVLRQANGIYFYEPHAKQHKFHSVGDKTGRYCRTGNRGGKTVCGAAEDIAFCMGGRVWYRNTFDILDGQGNIVEHFVGSREHLLITKGIPTYPIKLLLLVQDWDKAKDIFTNREGSFDIWGEYFKLIPREALGKIHTSRGGHIDRINIKRLTEFGGGESIIVIDTVESYKHAKMSAESGKYDAIHMDEPCPRGMFIAHKRGLVDRNGKFWINCTPLEEMWINDEFCPPNKFSVAEAPNGLEFNKLEDGGASRFMITWSIRDNPHNTPEAIAEFEASLTREERACRLDGLPLAMAGQVYKEFIYDLHVLPDPPIGWDDFHLPPKDHTIRVWWDYHTRLPQAVLFFATDPKGRLYVYDELFDDNLIDPVAKSIINKTTGYHVEDKEIDPFALIPHPVSGESIQDELLNYGSDFWWDPATKDLSTGVKRVRERLLERDPQGLPTIFFSPRLRQTLFEFSHYVYNDKNEPKDADNHMMENLYRAILNGCPYVEPEDSRPRRGVKPFVIKSNIDLLRDQRAVGGLLRR